MDPNGMPPSLPRSRHAVAAAAPRATIYTVKLHRKRKVTFYCNCKPGMWVILRCKLHPPDRPLCPNRKITVCFYSRASCTRLSFFAHSFAAADAKKVHLLVKKCFFMWVTLSSDSVDLQCLHCRLRPSPGNSTVSTPAKLRFLEGTAAAARVAAAATAWRLRSKLGGMPIGSMIVLLRH